MNADSLALLNEADRTEALSELTDEEALALAYDWTFWARPKQLPPPGDWFCWLIRSGRGFGKTRTGAQSVIQRAKDLPQFPIALVGQTKADVRDTMIELGDSSILKCAPPWFMPEYEPSKRRLTFPNGAVAIIYSGDEPDQLRGPQHGYAWVDELAKFKYPQETWDNLEFGLRLGVNPQVCVTTTPRPIPIIKALMRDPDTVDVHGSTYENWANLSDRYVDRVVKKYEHTTLGRQELHGELIEDNPSALWKRVQIEAARRSSFPDLVRVVVAIDPAVSARRSSDETGIIVAGVDRSGEGWVLEDATLTGSPDEWAKQAVAEYHKHKADRVVAEVNNGGDMIEHTIRTIEANIPFTQVRASR
ncbi:MAG: terminase family protein, partial [Chloroflexota bacterium]